MGKLTGTMPWFCIRSFLWTVTVLLLMPAGGIAQSTVTPTNDLPNPYQTIENYFRLPEGRAWGSTSAVEIDPDGESIWIAERCGVNSCWDRTTGEMSALPTVMKFDSDGSLVTSFGAGLLVFPHGIHVDSEGNVWVTDGRDNTAAGAASRGRSGPPDGATIGHQVLKFSPDGELLMTLGSPGGAGEPGYFYQPNDVLVAPDGSIFVAEGHGGENSRILKFSPDGTLIQVIGRKGTGPVEFDQPHALALDSQGRLFVGDRSNNRIQILDQDGNFIDEWYQFSRPSGIFITPDDTIYVADSESGSVARDRPEWTRGIRIGSARDGSLTAFIPDPDADAPSTSAAEGVAVDEDGNIYGAEVGPRAVKKYVRR